MNRILKFDMFEKVQPEWFKKNPKFYLSKAEKDLKTYKEENIEKEVSDQEYINKLKKLNIDEIEFSYNDTEKEYITLKPEFLISNRFKPYKNDISCRFKAKNSEYNYKILLAFIKYLNKDTLTFDWAISKEVITPLFKELVGYYALYYQANDLFITKNKDEYIKKIDELKADGRKIYYFNNKTKGKEFTDIELVEVNRIKNKLKNITIDDIYFTSSGENDSVNEELFISRDSYEVRFKDKELEKEIYKYKLISYGFFEREDNPGKVYFGHLRNRYHTRSIDQQLKGIGLGYKIYKAFLKFNGYMVSDEQTSMDARKIYLNLLKDNDIYYVIDKNTKGDIGNYDPSAKVMLIWKDYPKMEKLLRIVRTHELRNKRKYEYDKELLPYIQNITKKTV